jgi:nucleotide-binding universal stress UspA family protein
MTITGPIDTGVARWPAPIIEAVTESVPGDVVVGVDGSLPSHHTLQWALEEAGRRNVRCRVIKVLTPDAFEVVDRRTELPMFEFLADQQSALSAIVASIVAAMVANGQSSPLTSVELVAGDPVEVLAETARHTDLLVVGTRGHGALKSWFLGSVSSALLHRRVCPTVVIPSSADRHRGCHGIVVGVDGSDGAARALRWAADEAQRRNCELVVVHAWQVPIVLASPYAPTMVVPSEDCEQAGEAVMAETLRLVESDLVGPQVHVAVIPRLVRGAADDELMAAAADAALVVVGGRGHSGLAAAVLGSTSWGCVHHSPCPVAVIP